MAVSDAARGPHPALYMDERVSRRAGMPGSDRATVSKKACEIHSTDHGTSGLWENTESDRDTYGG